MSVLAWLLVPLLVTGIAFLVVGRSSRSERPEEAEQGMAGLDRMREAMSRPLPVARTDADESPAPAPVMNPSIEIKRRTDASAA